jgi:hypothetical protein
MLVPSLNTTEFSNTQTLRDQILYGQGRRTLSSVVSNLFVEQCGVMSAKRKTLGIRDIIRVLIDHGSEVVAAGKPSLPLSSPSPIQLAISEGSAEMVDELLPHMKKLYAVAKEKPQSLRSFAVPRGLPFQERYLLNAMRPVISKDDIGKDGNAASLSNELLAQRQDKAIEELPTLGADFSP